MENTQVSKTLTDDVESVGEKSATTLLPQVTTLESQNSGAINLNVGLKGEENGKKDAEIGKPTIGNEKYTSNSNKNEVFVQKSTDVIVLEDSQTTDSPSESEVIKVDEGIAEKKENRLKKRKIDQDDNELKTVLNKVSEKKSGAPESNPKRLKTDSSEEKKVDEIPANNGNLNSRTTRQTTRSLNQDLLKGSENEPLIVKDLGSETSTPTPNNNKPVGEKLSKRQEERLAKQKLREAEKIERDRKKEEERQQKKEEREKKELERKQKRELLEKEKQEKREQEKLKKEQRRLKLEEEKKAKEQERKQKEEERKKAEEMKDRSQMKISNFFAVKPLTKQLSITASKSSIPQKLSTSTTAVKETTKTPIVDSYKMDFLPFFQKRNVLLALHLQVSSELLKTKKFDFDAAITQPSTTPNLDNIFTLAPPKNQVSFTTTQQMVDALNSSQMTEKALFNLVKGLPSIKYLQFYENSKPPYVGTWCSEKHLATAMPPQKPLDTSLTGFDYDYDSDLDWQEGDEGDEEDIDDLDEGDEEEDEAEDDEMEDFVDNNDTNKRGHIGPLQSVSIWNDGTHGDVFEDMRYERLHIEIEFPIDPFKDYWSTPKTPKVSKEMKELNELKIPNELKAQPVPEKQKTVILVSQLGTPVKAETKEKSQTPNVLTPQKPVIKDENVVESLVEFIKKNSDFSIGTLSELAKKEFKIYTKSMLKHTIQEVAFYNKKTSTWEIKDKSTS